MAASLVLMHAFVHAVGFRGQHGPAPHRSGRPPEFLCLTLPGYASCCWRRSTSCGRSAGSTAFPPARSRAAAAGLAPFRAVNDGPAPAAQVRVVVVPALGDGRQERGEVVIDHLAARSAEEGGFLFAAEPGRRPPRRPPDGLRPTLTRRPGAAPTTGRRFFRPGLARAAR